MADNPASTVGARSGPASAARVVQMWRTVGRIQDGRAECLCFAALWGLNLEDVAVFPGARNWASERSLVGVPLEGVAREAGELRAVFVLNVPLGRPANDFFGNSLSRRP